MTKPDYTPEELTTMKKLVIRELAEKKLKLRKRREASLRGTELRIARLKVEEEQRLASKGERLKASGFFFYSHGDRAVTLLPPVINVEDLYQHFKARFLAEQENEANGY